MIVMFAAETHPHDMSSAEEFFEFDDHELGTIIQECLEEWCDRNPVIAKNTAWWSKIDVTKWEF